ncbi:hypothetical protein CERZMDRAFT_85944 [Cercospora zeae-maydis SCOH1-5]|uniref:Uncharacterized protein n=1 Tax=Cercospora zeae-maydis SCOH1-5 TaxID=717836 RepID=A0A6A6FBB0_9PEZI|nr:hypothetical protein CERZMDRAFT_85944 [Cercospora zeae-maydis SCOH1-5]
MSYLRRKNVTTRDFKDRKSLERSHLRAQQGLPDYHSCNPAELRKFCLARGLYSRTQPDQSADERTEPNKIKILQKADGTQTFNSFLNFPPEIRLMVYEWHFKDICERTSEQESIPGSCRGDEIENMLLPEPPLTKASRIIRQESLSIWYRNTTFNIAIDWQLDILGPATELRFLPHIQFAETERFLRTASEQAMQRIRKLHITGKVLVSGKRCILVCDYYVHLEPRGNIDVSIRARWEYSLRTMAVRDSSGDVAMEGKVRDIMTRRVNAFVKENVSVEHGFTVRNIDPFGKLFEELEVN